MKMTYNDDDALVEADNGALIRFHTSKNPGAKVPTWAANIAPFDGYFEHLADAAAIVAEAPSGQAVVPVALIDGRRLNTAVSQIDVVTVEIEGITLENIQERVDGQGWTAGIVSTWQHGRTETNVHRDSLLKWLARNGHEDHGGTTINASSLSYYMGEVHGWLDIADSVDVVDENGRDQDGSAVVLGHDPLPSFLVSVPLRPSIHPTAVAPTHRAGMALCSIVRETVEHAASGRNVLSKPALEASAMFSLPRLRPGADSVALMISGEPLDWNTLGIEASDLPQAQAVPTLLQITEQIDTLSKTDSIVRAAMIKQIALMGEGDQEVALAALKDKTKIKISILRRELAQHVPAVTLPAKGSIVGDDGHPVLLYEGAMPDQVTAREFIMEVFKGENSAAPLYTLNQGELVRLSMDSGRAEFEPVSVAEFKASRAKKCSFASVGSTGAQGPRELPDRQICEAVYHGLEKGDLPETPEIRRAPTVASDGSLLDQDRWDRGANVLVALGGLEVPPVSNHPTQNDVDQALADLLDDLLVDFPFFDGIGPDGSPHGTASCANALAMFLTPYMRDQFSGLVPMFGIDKPKPGTGGSELAQISALLFDGKDAPGWRYTSEEEFGKELLTKVRERATHFLFDNADNLQSQALMMVLTSREIGARGLNSNTSIHAPNTFIWIYTGNNVPLHEDLVRRIVRINLNTLTDNPKDRTFKVRTDADGNQIEFKTWVEAQRGKLIAALLTLIRFWVNADKPLGTTSLPSFEGWSRAVGGVLEAAGIEGFLTNGREAKASRDSAEIVEFITAWARKWPTAPVTESMLFDHAKLLEMGVLAGWKEGDQKRGLGRLLDRQEGRTFTVEGKPLMVVRAVQKTGDIQTDGWQLIAPPKLASNASD